MSTSVNDSIVLHHSRGKTLRSKILEHLLSRLLRQVRKGQLEIEFPSGERRVFTGSKSGPKAFAKINSFRVLPRMLVSGDLGIAESFIAGEWETTNLANLLALGNLNADDMSLSLGKSYMARIMDKFRHALQANSHQGSRRNIAAHYDLGNKFYEKWLDPSMSYSSAIFNSLNETMNVGQRRKYLRLAEKLDLQPGQRVLEIGCGWGGFAEIAAEEFGCQVVGLTLSSEQAAYVKERMVSLGLDDKVEVRLQDYRDVEGRFDHIVSIEMFEAVGEAYWPTYFDVLKQRLKPGGRAALQIITIDDERYTSYRNNPEFIQRYIFPGGMLPGPKVFEKAVAKAGLKISDSTFFGHSYAETLRRWDQGFRSRWTEISRLGFDDNFYRMWRYYFCYCEVGFDQGAIDVGQFIIEPE